MSRLLLIPWLAAAVFAACKRSAQPEPRYCPQDVSGVWVNSSDAAYAYRLNDHGDVVRGKFFHRAPDGGSGGKEVKGGEEGEEGEDQGGRGGEVEG